MKKAVLIGVCLVALTIVGCNQEAEAASKKQKPKSHHNNITVIKKTKIVNKTKVVNKTTNNTTNEITNVTNNSTTVVNQAEDLHNVAGVKIDAPNLVQISDNWTLGAEGGKDVIKNVFYDSDDRYFEADKGYFAYVKVTYSGTLFDFRKDEE